MTLVLLPGLDGTGLLFKQYQQALEESIDTLVIAYPTDVCLSVGATSPNIGAGKKRAAVCCACHGVDGISKAPGTPHLAGQDRVIWRKH